MADLPLWGLALIRWYVQDNNPYASSRQKRRFISHIPTMMPLKQSKILAPSFSHKVKEKQKMLFFLDSAWPGPLFSQMNCGGRRHVGVHAHLILETLSRGHPGLGTAISFSIHETGGGLLR